MMKRLALIAASLSLAATAHAATVSFTYSNPLQVTEISQSGNLGLFDSSLGTLTGAQLTVNGIATMTLTATNTSAQSQTATLTATEELLWSTSLAALNPFLVDTLLMSTTTGSFVYAAGQSRSFGPLNLSGALNDDLATILASLQASGGGAFSISCESISGIAIRGGGGNISTSQSTQAACGAGITYSYTPKQVDVPEPGSLALLGLGIMGLGALRRKRAG